MTENTLSRKKIQNGWAMYDWANSVYNLVIGSTIFPIFYDVMTSVKNADGDVTSSKVHVFGTTLENTELISYSTAFGLTIVCLVLPILSGFADYYGKKKFFLKFFKESFFFFSFLFSCFDYLRVILFQVIDHSCELIF